MKSFSILKLAAGILVLILGSSHKTAAASGIEPLVCVDVVSFTDYNGFYECYHICEDPDDPDPCPDCCPDDDSEDSGSSSGGEATSTQDGATGCADCGGSDDECCEEEGGGGQGGGERGQRGGGMVHWTVKQPRLKVFLRDKPFWYRPSRGPQIAFNLHYKSKSGTNGAIGTAQPLIFSVGTNWHTPWRSYIQNSPNGDAWTSYFVYAGDGSVIDYIIGVDEPRTAASLTNDGGQFTLRFNNGEKRIFATEVNLNGAESAWFLSRIEYPGRITNRFEYSTNGSVRLTKVIDADGRETTFAYTNSAHYSNLISKVIGPFGQTNLLSYTNGHLISIRDMMGLESKMEYTNGNIAKLVTPYGTNVFDYYSGTNWNALRIVQHSVRTNLYLRSDVSVNLFPAATNDSVSLFDYVLDVLYPYAPMFVNGNFNERSSFYWGPRQYANLSAVIFTNLGNGTFAPGNLTTNDFNKGHTRHWLLRDGGVHGRDESDFVGDTLGLEREPSPDANGSTEGRITWYDYIMQMSQEMEGNPQRPRTKAWKVSNDDWQVTIYDRAYNSRITSRISNYGPPGAMAWRTVAYTLGGYNVDVIAASGPGEQNYTRGFNYYHQLLNHTNALDEVTSYEYDNLKRLTNVAYPNGLSTTYGYDGNGYVSTIVDRSGATGLRTNSYTYTNGLIYTHTDERGLTTTRAYDAFGRMTKMWYPDSSGITNTYDKLHLVSTTDRLGKTSSFVYNSFRQVTQAIDPLSRTNSYDYCNCGTINSATDPLGNSTSYIYDNAGRRTRITFPGSSYTDFVYDTPGRVIRSTESSGVSVTNAYTINGLNFTATNAFGRIFLRSYDADDHVRVMIDHNGVAKGFAYDDLDRLLRATNSVAESFGTFDAVQDVFSYAERTNGPSASYRETVQFYDWAPEEIHNTQGEKIEYTYDLFGHKTDEVHKNAAGTAILTNRFKYDHSGNLTNLIDGKAQNTYWKSDQEGRVTNKVDHAGADMFRYVYDANGRLTSRWTPAKGTTSYSYDDVGNLTFINYPVSTDITLSYDRNNRLTNMVDAAGTTRYMYAGFGAVATEDGPWESDTVSYTYDNGRRRSGLSVQAANAAAWSQSYTYDNANRLTTLSSSAGSFTYGYHSGLSGPSPSSLVKSIALPNSGAITNNYDTRARMLGTLLRKNDGTLLNKHEYALNDLDQRSKMTRTAGDYVDYGYDPQGQLTNAVAKESGGVTNRWHEQFSYKYDASGNLTNRIQHRLTNSFTVNSLNQLTGGSRDGRISVGGTTTSPATNVTVNTSNSVLYLDYTFASTNHALTDGTNTFTAIGKDNLARVDTNVVNAYLPASPTYAYDSNGNLTYDGSKSFTFDDENQLTGLTATNYWKSEFAYDGKMRRRVRREFTWQAGTWRQTNEVHYVYDGNLVIQERDNFNLASVTYTRGTDLSGSFEDGGGIGGLLAFSQHSTLSPQHSYYHADGNGNVTVLLDTNQAVVAKYVYDPFGAVLSMSGSLAHANLYRFSSKEIHVPSGLLYYLYRYYDSTIQRWPNRDPLGEVGFETLRDKLAIILGGGPNDYLFVKNRPVGEWDALGLLGGGRGNKSAPRGGVSPKRGGRAGAGDSGCAKRECEQNGGTWDTKANRDFGGNVNDCITDCAGDWRVVMACAVACLAGPEACLACADLAIGICAINCSSYSCFYD
jgi:RHS repeat-associated protein